MATTCVISGSHYLENFNLMYFLYFLSNLEEISGKLYVFRAKEFIFCIINKL